MRVVVAVVEATTTVVAANSATVADWVMAGGTAVTALAAIAALVYGFRQVSEMRQARRQASELDAKRSQPYVVMTVEQDPSAGVTFDLVVENFGLTAAYGVEFHFAEPIRRSIEGLTGAGPRDVVTLPSAIPVLAPGQQWRTFWDSATSRYGKALPDRYEGSITYRGVDDSELASPVVLDLAPLRARVYSKKLGEHESATALGDIVSVLKSWTHVSRGAVRVESRDGDELDQQESKAHYRRLGIADPNRPRGGLRSSRTPTVRRRVR
jgi:hypothetical protein